MMRLHCQQRILNVYPILLYMLQQTQSHIGGGDKNLILWFAFLWRPVFFCLYMNGFSIFYPS